MLSSLFETIKATVFPNRCIVCGSLCKDKYFCENCKDILKPFKVRLCPKCGSPIKHCSCKFNFYYFDKIVSVFPNENENQKSFYAFKFGGHRSSAKFFSSLMTNVVSESFKDINFDLITTVPMHYLKRVKRGFNQSQILATNIAKALCLPFRNILKENKASKIQHKSQSIAERFLNVKGKYSLRKGQNLKGKTVLLVDDIMTTGATLSECARLLKLGGAEKVYAVTTLKTLYKENSANSNKAIEK